MRLTVQGVIVIAIIRMCLGVTQVQADSCQIGRDGDHNNHWRWVVPYPNPCKCTDMLMGGINTKKVYRPLGPDNALIHGDINAITGRFKLQCHRKLNMVVGREENNTSPSSLINARISIKTPTSSKNSITENIIPSISTTPYNEETVETSTALSVTTDITTTTEALSESNTSATTTVADTTTDIATTTEALSEPNPSATTIAADSDFASATKALSESITSATTTAADTTTDFTATTEDLSESVTSATTIATPNTPKFATNTEALTSSTTALTTTAAPNTTKVATTTEALTSSATTLPGICQRTLGVEDGRIADAQLSASTIYQTVHYPVTNARLNRPSQGNSDAGSWSPRTNNLNEWVQVDLLILTWVSGVMIQGREDANQWVTKYKVEYTSVGQHWMFVTNNTNKELVFSGNIDRNTIVTAIFPTRIFAKLIKIRPMEWNAWISMRFELIGPCPVCSNYLGMENGDIPDENIEASSYFKGREPWHARLNGDWKWSSYISEPQWIQADIGYQTYISGVVTQGDGERSDWVTSFEVSSFYSSTINDPEIFVENYTGTVLIYDANIDTNSLVISSFPKPVYAQVIRITCLTRKGDKWQMRFEVLGCKL